MGHLVLVVTLVGEFPVFLWLIHMIKGLSSGCTLAGSGSSLASLNLQSVSDPVDLDADPLGALYPL